MCIRDSASALAAARVGQILQSELGLAPTVITQQVNDYLVAIQHEKSVLMGDKE